MDFSGNLMLAFLEEDNTQRGLFHVRPLLAESGPIPQDTINAYQDTGFIRIVPDKNEQYTFKERMRTLGDMCLINLKDFAEDANKIRPNRNYAPSRGESHQFIIYSNAVQQLPEDLVFEVVAGKPDAPVALCKTPCCYLREGGRIEGPYNTADGSVCGALSALRPDSGRLFSIQLPDGQEKLFYWPIPPMVPEVEPSAKEKIQMMDEALPELDNVIREETAFRLPPPKTPSKLTGTPIFKVAAKKQAPKRAHNALNAIVDRMTREFPLEAPGAEMQDPSQLHKVDSPVDMFKRSLDALWHNPDAQHQAVEYLMTMPSAATLLSQTVTHSENNMVAAVMNGQLQDLEAERLSLIMQLDQLKDSKEQLMKEALDSAQQKSKTALDELEQKTSATQQALEALQGQQQALLAERQGLIDELEKLGGPARLLTSQLGTDVPYQELAMRLQKHLADAGFDVSMNDARHLMLLVALCPQVQLNTGAVCDSVLAARALSKAFGADMVTALDDENIIYLPGGDSAAFALLMRGQRDDAGYRGLIVSSGLQPAGKAFLASPWPVCTLKAGKAKAPKETAREQPVSLTSLHSQLSALAAKELPEAALQLMADTEDAVKKQGTPLPLCMRNLALTYIQYASGLMEGGIATAVDYAAASILLPHAKFFQKDLKMVEPLLHSLPMTAQLL